MGCSLPDAPIESVDDVAAVAFGRSLPLQAVADRIPDFSNTEDSLAIAERYIDQWIREQVLVHQAEIHLPLELQAFQEEMDTYRNALLLHHYKERYVQQRLATEVAEEDALSYYEEHLDLFVLTDYVVRATFVHLPEVDEAGKKFLKHELMSDDSLTTFPLEQWCVEHGAVHSVDQSQWWYLEDLLKELPLQLYRAEKQLTNRRLITFDDNGRFYFVRFLEHALKDGVAPYDLAQDKVKELILHSRRQTLLMQLEEDLLLQAWADGEIEKPLD